MSNIPLLAEKGNVSSPTNSRIQTNPLYNVLHSLPVDRRPQEGQYSPSMKILLGVLAAVLPLAGCRSPAEKTDSVPVVRMATVLGRVMNPFSEALAKALPDHFPAHVEVQKAKTSETYVKRIETGEIDFAMVQTDVAYLAYTKGVGDSGGPQRKLRGV